MNGLPNWDMFNVVVYIREKSMKKIVICLILLMLQASGVCAATIYLDFSTGTYNGSNTLYEEDGFTVEASHGFHRIRLDTLAWYEGDNIITVSADSGLFDLNYLTIGNRAFAGLTFESSKGGSLSVGSISGLLSFPGEEWNSIDYFTVTTQTHFDILNQLDNISVTTVPLPPSLLLFFSALMLLYLMKYVTRKSCHSLSVTRTPRLVQ
ncbi:MAG: hypothetical protein N0E58_19880 [Candidatus Thiodiazotropha endolucinida]|uniref:PEP-CTERM protein-sorting domain-containing protein n=1 Tax=Candidatus Thiodiazotropha taylori TaxID=2792791 RepID=A0A9E4NPJ3_9GAMM|nr:hypothetical protein [Candidatus Thiodiazotropha sp. (ex Lucina pensylvanica)]MBT3050824.1 hypothetical protein [Candidatus Thiodiazotropha sp. (ex Codakia orbicularis)]MCG7980375.1 hypothetical protein [Candidatus Thiodiazotropha taylori]MCW4238510.1 hypothetical protein [Candidatus Thiodiazotropha endolucinida]